VFTGVYPKPMLDRIEPSVTSLIAHVEERTGYEEPQPVVAEVEPEGTGAGEDGSD
jgi:NADH-quinone oxidoreductase subunit M